MTALIRFLTRENNGVWVHETGVHKATDVSEAFSKEYPLVQRDDFVTCVEYFTV
jgi:hypothetical protein